jgi:hypothetical protein
MSNNTFEAVKHANTLNPEEYQLKHLYILSIHPHNLGKLHITLDLIGPLPESQGHNTILTIVDWLTKAVKFEPTHIELNSPGFA